MGWSIVSFYCLDTPHLYIIICKMSSSNVIYLQLWHLWSENDTSAIPCLNNILNRG